VPRQQQADHRDGQAEPGRHEEDPVVAGGEGGGRGIPAGLRCGSGACGRGEHRQAYRPAYLIGGQAQLSEALGCEPPSVTLMTRKLEAAGHIRRKSAPSDKRASIVELTDSGKALADQVKQLWCALAEETVTGVPAQTAAELPGILKTLTDNVDTRRPRQPHGRRDGG
jgi:DNA-binding MarR family transcriptional regulator